MKRIVFYDGASAVPYSTASLDIPDSGIGGAQASVARVARRLALHNQVTVAQRSRQVPEVSPRLQWIPANQSPDEISSADAIVVLRRILDTTFIRRHNRNAPLFVWYHDWYFTVRSGKSFGVRMQRQLKAEARLGLHHLNRASAVSVSQAHASNIRGHFAEARLLRPLASDVRVDFIYNPIPDDLCKVPVAYDPRKLVFFSAQWKGLDMVLEAFQAVRQSMPDMQLCVASPGYSPLSRGRADNVTYLGNLSHTDVLQEVRTALCVFYPAARIPETFGLVFAESHAVGTPVLAHPFGAACELLEDEELVDARNIEAIVQRVRSWRDGARPVVRSNDNLKISTIADAWERLLGANG